MKKVYAVWFSEVILKCVGSFEPFENWMEVGKAIHAAKNKYQQRFISEHNFETMEQANEFYNEKVKGLKTTSQKTQIGEELTVEEIELLSYESDFDGDMDNISVERYDHAYVETKEDA